MIHCTKILTSVSKQGGGITSAVRSLSQNLFALEDLKLDVLALEDRDTAEDVEDWFPVEPKYFPFRGPGAWGYSPAMKEFARGHSPDIVHRHGLWNYPSRIASSLCSRGLPLVISPHGMLSPQSLRISALRKKIFGLLLERRFMKLASCFHVLSEFEAADCRRYGLNAPCAVIPNGIELAEPEPDGELPWSEKVAGKKILLYIGRLHPIKGLPTLLQGFADVLQKLGDTDWALVIAGWDQLGHRRELEELVQALAIDPYVEFVGPVFGDPKTMALHRASAFVLPSTTEGQPVAVLEAWAYGLPAVITKACNLPFAEGLEMSFECDCNVDGISRALLKLFEINDEVRTQMGLRAKNYTIENYCWKRQANSLLDVYKWLVGQGQKPDCVI